VASRELVVLGTASQAPTRTRNHNGYLLRWDDEGLLFDPGEGTQRQMLLAGVRASEITRVCLSHFHGDHCLGLPGVLQRLSLDRVAHEVSCYYPAEGQEYFWRLRHAAIAYDLATIREHPVGAAQPEAGPGGAGLSAAGATGASATGASATGASATGAGEDLASGGAGFRLSALPLSHRVPALGYQLAEPDGRRMLPERLAAIGISGPAVGELARQGWLDAGSRRVDLAEVSEPRRGQRFAFIMDTRLCEAAFALADGADLVVCESTFLAEDARLAGPYGHLTAGQAGQIAAAGAARTLVLTHFSQRYAHQDPRRFADEAGAVFAGEIVVAADLDRVPVPRRR
jgi:ribonuclease Z